MKRTATAILGALLISVCSLMPSDARAGSGYYYGAHFGFFDFFGDSIYGRNASGGYTFGPKVGAYFISEWLALAFDASIDGGIVTDDNRWFVNGPRIGVQIGTGFDAFMIYVGGSFAIAGIDNLGSTGEDAIRASLLNPIGFAGLQLGYGGFIVRGEFQVGHTLRINAQNYSFTNISITVGYGLYADFL